VGALENEEGGAGNGAATCLTPVGAQLLGVADALEVWLARCPSGPIELADSGAKLAVKALAEGWSSNLIGELAVAPRTLTELSGRVSSISYPAVERRITWMRTTGQAIALPDGTRRPRYVPSDWLRLAAAPLAIAIRCEQRHFEDSQPITDAEVVPLVQLALPLVSRAQAPEGNQIPRPTDGTVAIDSPEAWLDAVIDGRSGRLRTSGADRHLARGIHLSLFVHG
jgi:hypothetical protein